MVANWGSRECVVGKFVRFESLLLPLRPSAPLDQHLLPIMKVLSRIAPPSTRNGLKERRLAPSDAHKDGTKTGVLGHGEHGRVSKIQTLLEVMKCELAKPARSENGTEKEGEPTKQWTPLYYAVYYRREAALAHFLRAGQSPDGVADCEIPLLCIAVVAGHEELIEVLCNAGANVNATTRRDGETALHMAIRGGRSEMVETILSYGPDVDAKTKETIETPLHYAAKTQSLAIVTALLKHGANYAALDAKGRSPAEVALQFQNLHVAVAIASAARGQPRKLMKEKEMLLKQVEKVQSRSFPNNELIAEIIEAGCPPNSTPLVEAIKRGDAGLVELLLKKGADPNQASTSNLLPIFAALNCSGTQVVQALVLHGADVTLRDGHGLSVLQAVLNSAIHSKEAISTLFEILLANGADPRTRYPDQSTLLHRAVAKELGLAKVAQQLLQYVGVNEQDELGNTALHYAFYNRSCISVLLKYGADVNILNHKGLTPLLYATKTATKEKEPDLEYLIIASDLSKMDATRQTALHLASRNGLERTVRTLLQANTHTTCLDSKKRTPLLTAVLHHQWHIVPLLAVHPGTNSWDEQGLTALHHIAMSTPKSPSTWKDIASAIVPFCEKGVSRSMRDKTGATPLIVAVKTLPEKALPVIEVLLSRKGNCVGHEDLDQKDALFYAAKLGKLGFLAAILQCGAPFTLTDWRPSRQRAQMDSDTKPKVLKMMAEHEYLRRTTILYRQSIPTEATLSQILPLRDLKQLLVMGLDPNAPSSKPQPSTPLLWVVLNQLRSLPPGYLQDTLSLLFSFNADPNALSIRTYLRTTRTRHSIKPSLTIHPLTHLLEHSPTIDTPMITLFLNNAVSLSIPSTFYESRYPLHSAVLANRPDIIQHFLTHTPDELEINPTDARCRTPLFLAAEKGFVGVAEALIAAGAKIDVKDMDGNTALHAAALAGNEIMIQTLLRSGAKPCKLNSKGKTPQDLIPSDTTDKSRISLVLKHAEEQERRDSKGRRSSVMLSQGAKEMKKSAPPQHIHISQPSVDVEPSLATPVRMSKHMVSIHYTPQVKQQPQMSENASSSSLLPPLSLSQVRPRSGDVRQGQAYPRIDSGINLGRSANVGKAGEVYDGHAEDERGRKKRRSEGDELANWLAVSRVMEGG